ncbi:MAG: DUF3373 family protein [Sulfuricurvum sp.]|uniref:DUF3373 family protein n=1 Tax=Sulfuricurvum sp. TaxID=2025608 RepID=UPI00262F6666|nr:DUF3373 family protein [Sulfuricurvum sp.]MDD2828192.1 DUF3373 family protein [Sulfuricurvum sp.]MDD4949853.1 DUF3373 family protein [Sulfuricurvum sp.]
MKQRFLGSIVAAALITTTAVADDALMQRFDKMEKEMNALKAELNTLKGEKEAAAKQSGTNTADVSKDLDDIKDQISNLNKKTNGNNVKFGVDFRTSVDNLQYTMADGSKQSNAAFLSNRLWLNMNYVATKNLSFTGQLAYNKAFGDRSKSPDGALSSYDGFDWISSESAYNDTMRVRSAYFFYQDDEFLGTDIPWTISIGRRPSTEGHLINLRDDDKASSPLAHTVNVEFDGASAKFGMENLIGLNGSYFKLCAGRGMSNAEPRFNSAPYAHSGDLETNDIDMVGIIVVPYDDKQYSTGFQYTHANNLIDMLNQNPASGMTTVGALDTATAFAMVNGVGNDWGEFLDNTILFASVAMSKTDPYANKTMLGSPDSKTGRSYWIGAQFPSFISEEGKWGVEFNRGTKYWRPITYGEDTLIGSKIATRGNAYELYFTEPLVKDILTFQLRYTYIDYKFSGSNGFFGTTTGMPMSMSDAVNAGYGGQIVDKAQDIRAYIRYKF